MQRKFSLFQRPCSKKDKLLHSDKALIQTQIPLPDEILLNIFSFLSIKDWGMLDMVCKQTSNLSRDEALWKPHCRDQSKSNVSYKAQYHSERQFWQDRKAKFIVIGGMSSFNRALAQSYVTNQDFKIDQILIGVDFANKSVPINQDENLFLPIQYWLIGNNERASIIMREYVINSDCAILVVNMSDVSLNESQQWIEVVKSKSTNPDLFTVVIGHYDDQAVINITPEHLRAFSEEMNIPHCYVVHRHEKQEIEAAFDDLTSKFIDHYYFSNHLPSAIESVETKEKDRRCALM